MTLLRRRPAAAAANSKHLRWQLEYVLRRRDTGPTIVLPNCAGVGLKGWSALFPAIESIGTVFA